MPLRRAFLLEDLQVYRELFGLHFSRLFSCSPWESCIFWGNKCLGDQLVKVKVVFLLVINV